MTVVPLGREPISDWEANELQEVKWEMGRLDRRVIRFDCPWCGMEETLFCTTFNDQAKIVVRCDKCHIFVYEKGYLHGKGRNAAREAGKAVR